MHTPSRTSLQIRRWLTALALAACLLLAACAHVPRMLGGTGNENMVLDGEQVHQTDLPAGHMLSLDMRDPGTSGYLFAGASFNPDLLRLDSIEPHDGGARVRYRFTALAQGETEVIIKIRRNEPGYRPDVYKRIVVTITK